MQDHYTMTRYTLTAPARMNDGSSWADGFGPNGIREALQRYDIDGWTEHVVTGVWKGKSEPGVVFEIFRDGPIIRATVAVLGIIGRACLPDQEAVQVTAEAATLSLWEY